jgi:gliding motility-associated-like protein
VFIPVELNTKIISMRIFNRWGESICEKYGSESSWDGKFEGNKVQNGVYIYSII